MHSHNSMCKIFQEYRSLNFISFPLPRRFSLYLYLSHSISLFRALFSRSLILSYSINLNHFFSLYITILLSSCCLSSHLNTLFPPPWTEYPPLAAFQLYPRLSNLIHSFFFISSSIYRALWIPRVQRNATKHLKALMAEHL